MSTTIYSRAIDGALGLGNLTEVVAPRQFGATIDTLPSRSCSMDRKSIRTIESGQPRLFGLLSDRPPLRPTDFTSVRAMSPSRRSDLQHPDLRANLRANRAKFEVIGSH